MAGFTKVESDRKCHFCGTEGALPRYSCSGTRFVCIDRKACMRWRRPRKDGARDRANKAATTPATPPTNRLNKVWRGIWRSGARS